MSQPPPGRTASADEAVLARAGQALARGDPAVLVTVVASSGSAPRKPGAKMLVFADGQFGSIGGGAVEAAVVGRAREVLGQGLPPEVVRHHLTRDLAMCCGGTMSLFLEPMAPTPRLVVFGAGHVAQPLCAMASLAGFDVTVCDGRDEWLTEERFPHARERVAHDADAGVDLARLDAETYVVVVTHDHALDEEVVARVLARPVQPRFLGMIGSRRKRERVRARLLARGFAPEKVASMRTPVGLNVGAVTPEEIAVSIVGELVAVRRGDGQARPW